MKRQFIYCNLGLNNNRIKCWIDQANKNIIDKYK